VKVSQPSGKRIEGNAFAGQIHGDAKVFYPTGRRIEGKFFAANLTVRPRKFHPLARFCVKVRFSTRSCMVARDKCTAGESTTVSSLPVRRMVTEEIVTADGGSYEGMFFAGKKHGRGRLTDATGKVTEMEFFNSKLIGVGTGAGWGSSLP